MLPARIEDAQTDLKPPADWDPEQNGHCGQLAIKVERVEGVQFMVSAWEPEPGEVLALIAGGKVRLGVSGSCHPVVHLSASPPGDQITPVSTVRQMRDNKGQPCVEVETLWPPLEGSTTAHRGRCVALIGHGGEPMAVAAAFAELAALAKNSGWVE